MIDALKEMYGFAFMRNALAVGVFGGGMLAFLGIFIHLKRIVFLGAALPQITATGIAFAILISLSPLVGAFFGGLAGILLLSFSGKPGQLPSEGWIGLAYAAGGSAAVVLMALSPMPDAGALRFFTGDILGTTSADAYRAMGAGLIAAIVFKSCWSKLVVIGFDPMMSSAIGLKVHLWNAVLFLCLGFGLATVMNTAGSILAFSMLIGPPAAALILFRKFSSVVLSSITIGVIASFAGLTASYLYDLPGGPAMATAALIPVIPAWLVRKAMERLG